MFNISLTERERNLLIAGGVIIIVGVLYLGMSSILKWFDEIQLKKNYILDVRQKIKRYGEQYNQLKSLANEVKQRSQKTDITPIIENLIEVNHLKEKVHSMNPSNSTVEKKYTKYLVSISLRNVSAKELLTFIKDIENYSGVFLKIDYFSSRPVLRKPGLYNCQIKIATFTQRS